jgi:hypothetical protein
MTTCLLCVPCTRHRSQPWHAACAQHLLATTNDLHCCASCCRFATEKPDPAGYLKKGEGETIKKAGTQACNSPSPPKAGAFRIRENPPNTAFRRFYERGDLPIAVGHSSSKNTIMWKVRSRRLTRLTDCKCCPAEHVCVGHGRGRGSRIGACACDAMSMFSGRLCTRQARLVLQTCRAGAAC